MAVKAKAFLALEQSLTSRLQEAWGRIYLETAGNIQELLKQDKVSEAYLVANALSLDPIVDQNRPYLRYLAYSALFFGASRVSRRENVRDAMIGSTNLEPVVERTLNLLSRYIKFNLTFALQRSLLTLIADHEGWKDTTLYGPSDKDALKVKKAEQPILSQEFVSFRKEGDRMLQLISSLHTSRVSAYGYTVEADILGVKTYAVSEQLDNRICPVCAVMHGKTFQVREASDALNTILATEDPEMLKILQPWPKQDAESVTALKDLTSQELVAKNWHIPPYHPNCRGLLVHVDNVPKITDTASYQAAFGQPIQAPTLLTPADLLAFASLSSGYHGDPLLMAKNLADYWNKYGKGQDIFSTIKDLTGLNNDELLKVMAINPGTGNFPLDVYLSSFKDLVIRYDGPLFGSTGTGQLNLGLMPRKEELYISLAVLPSSSQGRGLMKQILRSWIPVMDRLGITKITLQANIDIGSYAWAKYGWIPDSSMLGRNSYFLNKLENRIMEAFDMPSDVYDVAMAAFKRLKAGDAKAIWAISDLKIWGPKLLRNLSWDGVLDTTNSEVMSRFLNYIAYSRVTKYNKCHLPAKSPNSTGGQFCSTDGEPVATDKPKQAPKKTQPSGNIMSVAELTKQFADLAIDIGVHSIEAWKKNMTLSPVESLTKVFGLTEEEVKERIKAKNKNKITRLSIYPDDDIDNTLKFVADGKISGADVYTEVVFNFRSKIGQIEYLKFHKKNQQGLGVGKHLVKTFVEAFKNSGMRRVDLEANIDVGGYAWAKYGWLPKSTLDARKEFMFSLGEVSGVPPDALKTIYSILDTNRKGFDSTFVWQLADLKEWGKKVMLGTDWYATLNLSDKRAMARYEAYVGK